MRAVGGVGDGCALLVDGELEESAKDGCAACDKDAVVFDSGGISVNIFVCKQSWSVRT